jgi:hypothetical protein
MSRRLGLASLLVVAFAVGGGAAGPARPLHSLRLVVSIAWLNAPEPGDHETQLLAQRVPPPSVVTVSRPPQPVGLRSFPVEGWLFQRPPPATL